VLVADGDAGARAVVRQLLLRLGQQVVGEAGDAATALHLARRLQPDVAVLELGLPGGTGLKLLARERLTAIVALTSAGDPEAARRAVYAGAGAYLAKPTNERRLLAAMELALQGFLAAQALRAEAARLREEADTMRLVSRAKALLVADGDTDPNAALARLHAFAERTGKSLREAASAVLLANQARGLG
jgi:response regulator NasT